MNHRMENYRLRQVERLAARHPGRWCWVLLVCAAVYGRKNRDGTWEWGWLREAEYTAHGCAAESRTSATERCYCGGFQRGVWRPEEVSQEEARA